MAVAGEHPSRPATSFHGSFSRSRSVRANSARSSVLGVCRHGPVAAAARTASSSSIDSARISATSSCSAEPGLSTSRHGFAGHQRLRIANSKIPDRCVYSLATVETFSGR